MIGLDPELGDLLVGGGASAILSSLQLALELEHATIPPYLYALYSISPTNEANKIVAKIIESVVIEEMLHLTLIGNVINALDGSPILNKKEFIPTYPGRLPGSVASTLTVPLKRCSVELVRDVFMVIEQPENPLEFPTLFASRSLTIGMFYEAIKKEIKRVGDKAFHSKPRNQIGPDRLRRSVIVTNEKTACQAIDVIIDQGEGTSRNPFDGKDPAHYYRFAQIVKGGMLQERANPGIRPEDQYFYDKTGHPVSVDTHGVYNVPDNPRNESGVSRVVDDNFSYTYTGMLMVLHDALNGNAEFLPKTLGLMMSLKQQAMDMMSGVVTGGEHVGPSFRYLPAIAPQ